MVATSFLTTGSSLGDLGAQRQIAVHVARGLAYAHVQGGNVLIQTPIAYPSGRLVGVIPTLAGCDSRGFPWRGWCDPSAYATGRIGSDQRKLV